MYLVICTWIKLIEDKLYQVIDQVNERKITSTKFYAILLIKIHSFYDGNGRVCKILLPMILVI